MNRTRPKSFMSLFVGGMEACWMVGALWLLEARTAPAALPVLWLMIGFPLAFGVWRLGWALSRLLRPAVGLAGMLVYVLLLIKFSAFPGIALMDPAWIAASAGRLLQGGGAPNPLQLTLLAAAATWVAGLRLATVQAGFDQILSEFQLGLLILLCVFFSAAQWGSTLPAMTPVVFIFFILFLLGMAATRSGGSSVWRHKNAGAYWLTVLALNAALIMGAGVLLTATVTPEALGRILGWLQAIWDWTMEWVIWFIAFLARLIPQPEINAIAIAIGGAGPAPQSPSSLPDLLSIPDYVRRIAAFLVSAFWVVLFAICLWRMAAQIADWLRRQMDDMDGAEIETLKGSFRQDLWRLLQTVRRRLAGWMAWMKQVIGRRPPAESMPAETAAVRRVYRALLSWSAAAGCPRKGHQTPHEFLSRLSDWLPEARVQLNLITERYTEVRYGDRRPAPDLIKTIEQTWQDVQKMRKRSRTQTQRDAFQVKRNR